MEVDIYWNDISEDRQQELIEAGFDNQNVTDGAFPLTTIFLDWEE